MPQHVPGLLGSALRLAVHLKQPANVGTCTQRGRPYRIQQRPQHAPTPGPTNQTRKPNGDHSFSPFKLILPASPLCSVLRTPSFFLGHLGQSDDDDYYLLIGCLMIGVVVVAANFWPAVHLT